MKDETLVNPAAVHNNLANALMSSNKIMEAIPHYKQALALDTNDAAAYMNLGVAFKHLNQFDKALEYFEKSLELRPTADEHYNMANTFIKLVPPNHEKAIFHYKHALRLNPQHANCHQNLGLMFKSKGMIDAAILEMREAVKCNDDADFRYNLGNALYAKALLMDGGSKEAQTKILEEAVQSYLRAIAMKADDPDEGVPESFKIALKATKQQVQNFTALNAFMVENPNAAQRIFIGTNHVLLGL